MPHTLISLHVLQRAAKRLLCIISMSAATVCVCIHATHARLSMVDFVYASLHLMLLLPCAAAAVSVQQQSSDGMARCLQAMLCQLLLLWQHLT